MISHFSSCKFNIYYKDGYCERRGASKGDHVVRYSHGSGTSLCRLSHGSILSEFLKR